MLEQRKKDLTIFSAGEIDGVIAKILQLGIDFQIGLGKWEGNEETCIIVDRNDWDNKGMSEWDQIKLEECVLHLGAGYYGYGPTCHGLWSRPAFIYNMESEINTFSGWFVQRDASSVMFNPETVSAWTRVNAHHYAAKRFEYYTIEDRES
jgi:hypothetical protein